MKIKATSFLLGLAFVMCSVLVQAQANQSLINTYGSNYEEVLDKYGDNPLLLKKAADEYAYYSELSNSTSFRAYFAKMNGFTSDLSSPFVERSESEPNNFFPDADNIDDVINAQGVLSDEYTGKMITATFDAEGDVDVYEFTVDTSAMYYFNALHGTNADGGEMSVSMRLFHESDLDTTFEADFNSVAGNGQIRGDILGRNTDGRGGAGLFRLSGWSSPVNPANGEKLTGKFYLWVFQEDGAQGTYNMTAYKIPFEDFRYKAEPNYPYSNLVVGSLDPLFTLNTDAVVRSYMLYSDTVKVVEPALPSQSNSTYPQLLAEGDEDVDLFFLDYKADHILVVETLPYFGFYRENDGSIGSGSTRMTDPRVLLFKGDGVSSANKLADNDDGARERMDGPNNIHSRVVLNPTQLAENGITSDQPLVVWVAGWASQERTRLDGEGRSVDNRDPGRAMYDLYAYQYHVDPDEIEPNNTVETAQVVAARTDTVYNGSFSSASDDDHYRVFLSNVRMYSVFTTNSTVTTPITVEVYHETEAAAFDGTTVVSTDLVASLPLDVQQNGNDILMSTFTPEEAGAYIIKLSSASAGDYQLGVVDKGELYPNRISNEPDNDLAGATSQDPIQIGAGAAAVNAAIYPAGDIDHFYFTTGDDFTVTIRANNSDLVDDFSAKLTLFDASVTTELASSTNGALSFSPSESQTYVVRVEAANAGDVGFYVLSGGEPFEEQEPNNDAANATPVVLGELYEASLGSGDTDFFSVNLKAGSLYSFRGVDNETGGALSVEFLDNPDGTTLLDESGWPDNYSGNFKIANIVPLEDATYYLKISGNPGAYKILSRVNDRFRELEGRHEPDNSIAEAAALGSFVMDGVDREYVQFARDSARFFGDEDFFELDAKAGMKIVAETKPVAGSTGSSSDPDLWNRDTDTRLRLFAADGTELESDDDGGNDWYSKIEYTVPADGKIYLQVANSRGPGSGDDRSMRRGDYILNVAASFDETEANDTFAGADSNPIIDGGFVNATFATDADIDIFSVNMDADRIYHLRSTKDDGDDSTIGVELFSSSDTGTNLLADGSSFNTRYSGDNFKINFIPPTSGTYYLRLTAPAASADKPYKVYMKSNDINALKDLGEPNNSIAEAAAIGDHPTDGLFQDYMLYNEGVEGFHDDVDYYQVPAVAGDTLIAESTPFDGELWPRDFDAYMYLFAADGTELATNDDGGFDWHSKIEYVVPTDGDYYFLVIGQDAYVPPRNDDSNRIRDPARGEYKFKVTKLNGGIVTSNEDEQLAYDFDLKQNYPNPFNPSTNIQYTLNKAADVTLEVYNILGQRVATLVNVKQTAGAYTVNFDARNLSSGVYIYRLQAGNQVKTNKMLLIK